MPVTIRDSIYSGIAEQFPDIYKEQGDFLVEFIQAYYQHNDEKMDRDIPKLKDIDTTLTTFLVYYKKKYLADLPLDTALDIRFIIKHIQDMYKRKGTQESLELLFRLFFDLYIIVHSRTFLYIQHCTMCDSHKIELRTKSANCFSISIHNIATKTNSIVTPM